MSERKLQNEIRLALGKPHGCVFFRNSVGVFEVWDPKDGGVRVVHAGLCKGSADIVGIVDGRFTSLEIKTATGRVSQDQINWANVVRAHGGFHAVVRSVDEALRAVEDARR